MLEEDINKVAELSTLAVSPVCGVHIAASKSGRQLFIFGHAEYDRETLSIEYFRDLERGLDTEIPFNYFKNNDASMTSPLTWASHSGLMYSNWLNFCVYQATPFDLTSLPFLHTA